jgi:two-component system cell cycle sensor histidine kinase/response regulator CckA
MKLDNSEFIARHHKGVQAPVTHRKGKFKYDFPVLAGVVLIVVTGGLLFWMQITNINDKHMFMGTVGLISVLLLGVMYRLLKLHRLKERRVDIIQEVLEGSRGARLITDSTDKLVYSNQKFNDLCEGIGAPSYESLIKLFEDNPETLAHFRLLADQAHRGLTDSIELFSKNQDRDRWYAVTAQPVAGWAGYIHWRIDDVTQEYTVDRAIREEREKLIDFTDNAPVGFFSVDENGRFVFANATFARWVGQDIETLLSTTVLHTYLVDPPQNARPYDLAENGGAKQIVELKMKGPAGKIFLASINQAVVHETEGRVRTRAVVHDLTAEREMRQALQASEDRFQKFFEEAPLGIVQIDADGKIQDCNSQFAALLNAKITAIEGQDFNTLIQSENKADILDTIKNIALGKATYSPMDVTLGLGDKSAETQMHARRFKDSGNVVLHFIDMRQQKALEAQFVQSQKMQAIGQLAGGIAHDFNNLLTAIIGFCDLLLLRHKPGDPSFGDIMQIKQNSNRAANLVRQLLAFSRQQTLRPRVQDISDILTELSHLMRRLIGASVELDIVHGSDLGLVKVDEGQMEQVLINLAVNARDAMDNSGSLVIATENFTNRKPIELVTEELPPGHWTVIKVTDTGCGIPSENLTRIFEPFFTTKEVGHGTGLGLATVYGIIRQTDGYLDVKSDVGKGTSFIIYLPRATETEVEQEDTAESSVDETKDLTGTERILLVEDEDAVRTFSVRALTNKGYEVLAADCGDSALKLMEDHANQHIDLLVTDVVMPGIDGPTLAQRMRQNSPKLKIIFMSGYTEDRLKDHMGENVFFLPKPFTLKQLAEKVKDVLAGV